MADKAPERNQRSRNYSAMVYPDSALADWIERLKTTHIPALISPLHDQDRNEEGNLIKPHYHVILLYSSLKSERQVREVFDLIGATGCKRVHGLNKEVRFLTHEDEPDKVQYSQEDVTALNGANYQKLRIKTKSLNILYKEALNWIDKNQCTSFVRFMEYAVDEQEEWARLFVTGSYGQKINHYIGKLKRELSESDQIS